MTNREVITAALRMLGVLGASDTASAEDAALGLDEMNDLLADLAKDGVDLGFPPQDNVSEDFPLDDGDAAAIKPILAMRLFTYFPSQQVPSSLPGRAENATQRLYRDAALANIEEATLTHVPLGEAYKDRGDIING